VEVEVEELAAALLHQQEVQIPVEVEEVDPPLLQRSQLEVPVARAS
jgi:hypothetical protein